MTEQRQDHRSILVTGSSRGIGRAIAERLAASGFQLVLHCRDNLAAAEDGARRHRECRRPAAAHPPLRHRGPRGLRRRHRRRHRGSRRVFRRGLQRRAWRATAHFPALSDEDWDTVLRTNLDGFYNVLHPAIMPMIRRRAPARIVTLSSVSGVMGNRGQVNYSASKAGIIGATKALAVELASRGITVNCVAPGLIRTDMMRDAPVEEALKIGADGTRRRTGRSGGGRQFSDVRRRGVHHAAGHRRQWRNGLRNR